jgi:hypothetical protein
LIEEWWIGREVGVMMRGWWWMREVEKKIRK